MKLGLNTVDIDRFVVDEKSYLGQTIKLGVEYGLLPENASEALRMYLQMHTVAFGQKNRSGISIGREAVEQGLFQATVCLDVGLKDQSEGDANRAAEILATGDFESVRKRGWELAFFRLEEMQQEANLFPQRRESAFLTDYTEQTERWGKTAPETWVYDDPDGEDEPAIVDPSKVYGVYQDLMLRIGLLKGLPVDALKRYGSAAGGTGPFADILRNLIVSLAIGSESLVHPVSVARAFAENPFSADGIGTSEVLAMFEGQIPPDADAEARDRFIADVRAEIGEMSDMHPDSVEGLVVTVSD